MPGERIRLNASVENFSSRTLDLIQVKLRQDCYFHATSKTRLSSVEISNISLAFSIEPNEKKVWNNVELMVPEVLPSLNGHIIEIKYSLVFSFKTSNLSIAKTVLIPIVIGTIPFSTDSISSLNSNPPSYSQLFNNQRY